MAVELPKQKQFPSFIGLFIFYLHIDMKDFFCLQKNILWYNIKNVVPRDCS